MLGALLPTLCPAGSFASSSLLCVLPAVRRTFWLSDLLLVTGARLDAQHLAPRCPSTHAAYSSPPDILVVTRPSLTTLRYPGYAESFGALLVTWRFPVCPSCLACRNPQWPSWSLLALLVARQHPSGSHTSLIGALLAAWHTPGHWQPRWSLCILTAVRRRTDHSACLFTLIRVCLATRCPRSTRCPHGALQTKRAPSAELLSVSALRGPVYRRYFLRADRSEPNLDTRCFSM